MKLPRVTLATVGFVILVAAIDFGLIRWAFRADSEISWFSLAFLPMINVLLAVAYRARKREAKRWASRVAFLAAGSIATAGFFTISLLFPEAIIESMSLLLDPAASAIFSGLVSLLGNQTLQIAAVREIIAISLELFVMITFCSIPPLLIALLAGRIGRLWDARRPERDSIPIEHSLQTS